MLRTRVRQEVLEEVVSQGGVLLGGLAAVALLNLHVGGLASAHAGLGGDSVQPSNQAQDRQP